MVAAQLECGLEVLLVTARMKPLMPSAATIRSASGNSSRSVISRENELDAELAAARLQHHQQVRRSVPQKPWPVERTTSRWKWKSISSQYENSRVIAV